jgi:hypothetical protein
MMVVVCGDAGLPRFAAWKRMIGEGTPNTVNQRSRMGEGPKEVAI